MNCKDTRKDQLLEVASTLFYEQGFHATGIQQIIAAADIAKGTFYSHYKSKDELGVAWLKSMHKCWAERRAAFLSKVSDEPAAQILALFDYLRASLSEGGFRGCAFINTLAETPDCDNPMRIQIVTHKQGFLDFIRGLVDQRFPEGSEEENAQRAGAIFLLFEASIINAQNFRSPWPIEVAQKQVRQILAA